MMDRSLHAVGGRVLAMLLLIVTLLLGACATEPVDTDPKAHERSWQEKIHLCSKISNRSERDRCMYGK